MGKKEKDHEILTKPLPDILDRMDEAIKEAKAAAAEARKAATEAREAGEKAAEEAARVAEAKIAEAQSALGQSIVALRHELEQQIAQLKDWANRNFSDAKVEIDSLRHDITKLKEAAIAGVAAFDAKIKE